MKYYPPDALQRAARAWAHLRHECDMVEHLRSLVITDGKATVARRLGISDFRLTGILRGRGRIDGKVAQALGYRRVVRFEPIE